MYTFECIPRLNKYILDMKYVTLKANTWKKNTVITNDEHNVTETIKKVENCTKCAVL